MLDHRVSACTLPENGDPFGIAAKRGHVILYPLQCQPLVINAPVSSSTISCAISKVVRRKKSEHAHSVIYRDPNYRMAILPRQINHWTHSCSTVHNVLAALNLVGPSMDVYDYRTGVAQ